MDFIDNNKETENNEVVFHGSSEAMTELEKIKPANLKSNRTTVKEAVRLCKEVMTVFSICVKSNFTHNDMFSLVGTLKELGCTSYDQAAPKFTKNPEKSVGWGVKQKNNIEFPLSAFGMLMSSDSESSQYGWGCMSKGGPDNCWIDDWLYTQERTKDDK